MQNAVIGLAAMLSLALPLGTSAVAAENEPATSALHFPLEEPRQVGWSFAGPFGKYDPQQLQRGYQIYHDVCSTCHSMSMVAFRDLASTTGPHFTEDEVKALAAEATVSDPSVESGSRPGRPYDYFPPAPPYPAGHPPDLSLIAKARGVERGFPRFVFDAFTQYQEGGPDYVYSFLTGFQDPPADVKVPEGLNYNPYFISSAFTAMPPQLSDGLVHYAQNADEDKANDVPETVDQYAKDVTSFLMWAAEPHLVERKAMGLTVMVFLVIFACLVYYTKKKVWSAIPHGA